MFEWASSYNQPLNTWNVSKVTNLESMFALAQWSVSNLSFAYRHLVPAKIFAFNDLANNDIYNG